MPTLRKPHRIAVLCSDLHLSLLQPACRADKDWMEVQHGYLLQLKNIAFDQGQRLPVICAGDIFDRWNAPPELINFALDHLPDGMLCVPGQHDLPNHRIDQIGRSGYGVLVKANKIVDISGSYYHAGTPGAYPKYDGFGWGQDIKVRGGGHLGTVNIAVVHRYCWKQGKSYPGAPEENNVSAYKKELKGYDAAVFGDNHKGFMAEAGKCNVINTGGFIRRKSDEMEYRPRVGILYSDGTIKCRYLDTSGDKFHEVEADRPEVPVNMQDFIDGLEELGEHGLNFREAVENHLRTEEVSKRTKQIILEALDA
jgi:hypothetical protein